MITRKSILNIFCLIYILVIFKVFQYSPVQIVADIFLVLLTFVGVVLVASDLLRMNSYYRKMLIIYTMGAIVSIFAANYFFDQNMASGIMAVYNLLFLFSCSVVFKYINLQGIDFYKVLEKVITMAWVYWAYILISVGLNLRFTFEAPLSGNTLEIDAQKLPPDLIILASFYYLAKFLTSGKPKNIVLCIIMFSVNHVADVQRGILVLFAVTALVFVLKKGSKKSILALAVLLPALGIGLFLVGSEFGFLITAREKFAQVFLLFTDQSKVSEPSVKVRISEIEIALKHFYQSPIIGKGILKASESLNIFKDQYFYYSDIGIFAILFRSGLTGILLYFYHIRMFFKLKSKKWSLNPVKLTMYLYLFYMILMTLQKATIIYAPVQFIFFMVLLKIVPDRMEFSENPNTENETA